MKELNRRAFLKLSGASAALLALAACGGGSSAPPAHLYPDTCQMSPGRKSTIQGRLSTSS